MKSRESREPGIGEIPLFSACCDEDRYLLKVGGIMQDLSNYLILDKILESGRFFYLRACRTSDQRTVILKGLRNSTNPSERDVSNLQHEFYLFKKLELPGFFKAIELIQYQNSYVIVFENAPGIILEKYIGNNPVSLSHFFVISLQMLDIIDQLHKSRILHKNIHPKTFLIDPANLTLKAIDLSAAVQIPVEGKVISHGVENEESLAYISPEQTGRMNRPVDFRSDYYSLGTTFYEMLLGFPPFRGTDAIELIHSHMAKIPKSPFELRQDIPQMISRIVVKLLAKNAEERYHSTDGLRHDLVECSRQWSEYGAINDFQLASHDNEEILYIPQKLFGRDKEFEQLQAIYTATLEHQKPEIVIIKGRAGVGKTFLVQELQREIDYSRSYYISGHFDELQKNTPRSAVIDALNDLVHQFLMEPDAKLLAIKEAILSAVGNNGQVIVDLLPSLENVIGKQSAVPELSAVESQNRFNIVFQNFLSVLAELKSKFIIFLDNVQWSDTPSLRLIEMIVSSCKNLLLILSYRDNEISQNHAFKVTLKNIKKNIQNYHEITLQSFSMADVDQILIHALDASKEDIETLSNIVFTKTRGNPLSVLTLLKTASQKKMIKYSYQDKRWIWNLTEIIEIAVSEDVLELITSDIKKLPESVRNVLMLASVVGEVFDLHIIAILAEKSLKQIAAIIWQALEQGLITYGDDYAQTNLFDELLHIHDTDLIELKKIKYRFIHERIRKATYDLIDENEKKKFHLEIARYLRGEYAQGDKDEGKLFALLSHYNKVINEVVFQPEKYDVAKLNLAAAMKAKKANAYTPAIGYLNSALAFMGINCWQENADLAYMVYKQLAECEQLVGQYELAEQFYRMIFSKVTDRDKKVEIYQLMMMLNNYLSKYDDVLQIGIKALNIFNFKIPMRELKTQCLNEILKLKIFNKYDRLEKMAQSMICSEENEVIQIINVLSIMQLAALQVNYELFAYLALKMINLSAKYGLTKYTPIAFISYAIMLIIRRNFSESLKYANLALVVASKAGDISVTAKVYTLYGVMFNHWQHPLATNLDFLSKGYQYAIESGELLWVAINRSIYCGLLFSSGKALPEILSEVVKNIDFLSKIKEVGFYKLMVFVQKCLYLISDQKSPSDEELRKDLEEIKNIKNTLLYISAAILYAQSMYLTGKPEVAYEFLRELYQDNIYRRSFTLTNIHGLILYALSMSIQYKKESFFKKIVLMHYFRSIKREVKKWAHQNPHNFLTFYLLLQAEYSLMKGRYKSVERLYDETIISAQQRDFKQYTGVINERAGTYYVTQKRDKIAKIYLYDAYQAYLSRHAMTKVKQLQHEYAGWMPQIPNGAGTFTTDMTITTFDGGLLALDLDSLLKASQAISKEIILDNFLKQMMQILLESAGAEKGFLIIESGGKLVIAAEGNTLDGQLVSSQMQSIYERSDLPISLIVYVKRTHDDIVLNDAKNVGNFVKDAYIDRVHPKSILAMPILNHGQLTAILYLENNLITNAFTKERLKILKALSSQAAISLENARLFTASGRFVPHEFLSELNKASLADVHLGDQIQKTMSVMFCDIRRFTAMSEAMSTSDTFNFINEFFASMEPAINRNHGFIDKYIGDAIMALFDRVVDDAVLSAIDMVKYLQDLNTKRVKNSLSPISLGIGINTGDLILGIIGNKNRMESSVIGDAVNIAARVEQLTKYYDVTVLLTDQAVKNLSNPNRFSLRLIDEVVVRGKTKPLGIWEVCDVDPPALKTHKMKNKEAFCQAQKLFKQKKYDEAEKAFKNCLDEDGLDTVVKMYVSLCQRREDLKNKRQINYFDEGIE